MRSLPRLARIVVLLAFTPVFGAAAQAKAATSTKSTTPAKKSVASDPLTAAIAKATSPSQCLGGLRDYVFGVYKASQEAKHPISSDSVDGLAKEYTRRCAAKLAKGAPASELGALAQLYSMSGQKALADSATERSIAAATTPQARAIALGQAALSHADDPRVEARYTAALDSLPRDVALPMQFNVHSQLLARYRHEDNDAELSRHARAVIAIVPLVPEQAHGNKELQDAFVTAYKNLAEAQADDGFADSSLVILEHAERELAWVPGIAKALAEPKLRYSLVGKPAPMIDGKLWLNSPAGTTTAPLSGKVGVVQFTATWCPPCKRSYPELRTIAQTYAGKPVQLVLHTTLYGTFEGRDVTDAEEIAATTGYYANVQKLDVPIGIQVDKLKRDSAGQAVFENAVDDRYGVTDIPTTIVVDRGGVVRLILTGWDAGNPKRITAMVDRLLAEPVKTSAR
jgi:thiol-disulfide isomerase/thioredoxin